MLDQPSYTIRRSEFNLFFMQSILLGALLLALMIILGAKLLTTGDMLSEAALMALGFFFLGLTLYPSLNIRSRNVEGRELSLARYLFFALLGSVVGGIVSALL